MKLETFFEKFDQFAEAPDTVARMRELVLNFAVQGKLVPQDPDDEPADAILSFSQFLFEQLVAAKKLARPKPLKPIKDAEVPFILPKGWAWCRFGQIMRISSGDGLVAKDMIDGPIPVYGGNGVNGYHNEHNVKKRTIVIGRVGFYCGSIHVTPEKAWVTDNAFVTVFDENQIDMDFLSWLLRATDLRKRDNATAQPVISGAKVYPTVLALPPLAEQKRIVAKVDELMALCDRLEAQQQERDTRRAALARASLARFADAPTPANLNILFHKSYDISPADLRKSILTLAVQGKLVPQDPNDEPAVVLMEKIAGAIKGQIDAGNVRAMKPLTTVTENEKTFPLPTGWVWARLQEVIDVRDGTHDSPKDSTDPDAFPLVTSRNFENGDINFETTRRISAKDHFEIQKRSKVEKHDILFSMIGGNIGNQVIVKTDAQFSVKNVALFKYYDRSLTYPLFIKRYMEHLAIRLQQESVGGAQPFVSLGYFRKLPIALPPTAEQRRIVAKVDQLMALVDELETHLAASRTTAKNLLEALVAELTAAGAPPRRGDA